jgi:hypothetical protein
LTKHRKWIDCNESSKRETTMAEGTCIEGTLLHYGETGYEGPPWAFARNDAKPGEWGLEFIRPGDRLTVTNKKGKVLYDDVLLIKEISGIFPRWYPHGISKEHWSNLFIEEHAAKLVRGVPDHIAMLVRDGTMWHTLTHIESYTTMENLGLTQVFVAFHHLDPKRTPTRMELWFKEGKISDIRPL